MFDWLRYRYRLSQLQRERREIRVRYEDEVRIAKQQNKSEEDISQLWVSTDKNLEEQQVQIFLIETNYLVSKSERLLIALPRIDEDQIDNEKWRWSPRLGQYYLTPEGMTEVRAAIRADKKERSEVARSWLPGLTGLIGVLIGLLAIILGRR
jgi:hypothetical protein